MCNALHFPDAEHYPPLLPSLSRTMYRRLVPILTYHDSTRDPMTKRAQIVIAFGLVYVVWGSSFVAIRYAARVLNPALLSGIRFVLASVLLMAFLALRGHPLRLPRAEFGKIAFLGFLMFTINTVLVNYSSRTLSAGLVALILATIPLLVGVLESIFPGTQRMSAIGWAGTLTGFIGVGLLIQSSVRDKMLVGSSTRACFALLIAATAWAGGSVLAQRMRLDSPPLLLCAWQMLVGGIVNLLIGALTGSIGPVHWTPSLWGAVLYLAIFGSLLSYTSYLFLLRTVPVSHASTYAYVNPVVAVALGTILQHEPLRGRQWADMAIVIFSVAIVVGRRHLKSDEHAQLNYQPSPITER